MCSIAGYPLIDNISGLEMWEARLRAIEHIASGEELEQLNPSDVPDNLDDILAAEEVQGWDDLCDDTPPRNALEPPETDMDDLAGYSPRDKPWNVHKGYNDVVRDMYMKYDGDEKHADRMRDCAEWLEFAWAYRFENGADAPERRLRLQVANFCHVRGCPVCAWRRSLKMKALAMQRLPAIMEEYPSYRFLFLTLTVKNCDVQDLSQTIKHMSKSWERMRHRKEFNIVKGWFRTTEFTRGQDGLMRVHPHYHLILHVPSNYFTTNYVRHETWRQIWRECAELDYDPLVNVKAVKKGDEEKSVKETMKYVVKEADIAAMLDEPDGWYVRVFEQLRQVKLYTSSGTLKNLASEIKNRNEKPGDGDEEDLLHIGDGADEVIDVSRPVTFDWHTSVKQYRRRKA